MSAYPSLEILVDGLCFPEAPRWREGRLWFSDFYRRQVLRTDMLGIVEVVADVPANPSGLGWRPDGSLLVVSMNDCRVLRARRGDLQTYADLAPWVPGPCNDMLVESSGRAWVGNFGFNLYAGEEPRGTDLLCIEPDGSVRVAARDLLFPNGMALTPDGRRLIVAETFGERITVFDVDASGTLSRRRVFADLAGRYPDGLCLDAEGAVWVADARGNRVLRVTEADGIVDTIGTGEQNCYACMLGGDDGRTLFLCTAPGIGEDNMVRKGGRIQFTRVTVPHAGLP
ncbi:SMP-30/gluconolactonase/LRE family protein [Paraburkholderia sp. J12]|uniref:SMP-30/gluconolactonase/LRE family protein n=1 Tax=Paraburkholderia sp. J12 TaxID=2805432 RepID=UPI002ABD292C|nr:SMP-30/gluconolactonase/LRE family protein [Paraburkholderia sp. J12]